MAHDENYFAECYAEYMLKHCREEGIPLPCAVEEDPREKLLISAIPYVIHYLSLFIWSEEDFHGKADTVTIQVSTFSWDDMIKNRQGQQVLIRDVVNTEEFRTSAAEKLSKKASRFCTIHALERDTDVSVGGQVLRDTAILTATFSRDGPCDECGKHSKNGRATCLCPFDQDDLRKMDVELRRC